MEKIESRTLAHHSRRDLKEELRRRSGCVSVEWEWEWEGLKGEMKVRV